MNYSMHYERLIARAKNRVLDGYVEVHHVIPKCMGGSDSPENLVRLTAEEHYVAHQLLHKMYPKIRGLAFSMIAMTGNANGKRNNKLYGWMRKDHSKRMKQAMLDVWKDEEYVAKQKAGMEKLRESPEYLERVKSAVSKAHKGRIKSEQERANIAAGRKGAKTRKFSEQARANMAEARRKTWAERKANGTDKLIAAKIVETRRKNGSYTFTAEHRAKIGLAQVGRNKGKKLSDAHREAISKGRLERFKKLRESASLH